MTLLVSCQSISKSFGAQPLFTDISIGFDSSEKSGLIGQNGSGKSTFLKIIARLESTDSGEISTRKDIRLVYLPQEDLLDSTKSIEENLLESLWICQIEDTEYYLRLQKMIAQVEFPDSDEKVETLSGGWRKRLSIACALIQQPDLLLMDEPTNHLDLEGIIWLEGILKKPEFAYILISHDRFFLENCTNRIVELGRQYPDGYMKIEGNYSEFLVQKQIFLEGQSHKESSLANRMNRELEWLRRGPKARSTKARFRINDAHRLQEELNDVRHRNRIQNSVKIDFSGTNRKTKRLLVASNVKKSMANKILFEAVDLVLTPGLRLGLLGRNGTGKSTLLHIISGDLEPDGGEIKKADEIRIVLFDQKREQLNLDETLRIALSPSGDSVVYRDCSIHVTTWAKRFLFRPDQLDTPVSKLSGGEQARILIARLMLQPADILLLDEPGNDLDISTLEILEESLVEFPGAIILVSHDRFLLDQVTNHILVLDGEGAVDNFEDYTQYLENQVQIKEVKKNNSKSHKIKAKQQGKLSWKDQQELDNIEEKIQLAEENLEKHQKKLEDSKIINNSDLLQSCCRELEEKQKTVENLYERWAVLEDLKAVNR